MSEKEGEPSPELMIDVMGEVDVQSCSNRRDQLLNRRQRSCPVQGCDFKGTPLEIDEHMMHNAQAHCELLMAALERTTAEDELHRHALSFSQSRCRRLEDQRTDLESQLKQCYAAEGETQFDLARLKSLISAVMPRGRSENELSNFVQELKDEIRRLTDRVRYLEELLYGSQENVPRDNVPGEQNIQRPFSTNLWYKNFEMGYTSSFSPFRFGMFSGFSPYTRGFQPGADSDSGSDEPENAIHNIKSQAHGGSVSGIPVRFPGKFGTRVDKSASRGAGVENSNYSGKPKMPDAITGADAERDIIDEARFKAFNRKHMTLISALEDQRSNEQRLKVLLKEKSRREKEKHAERMSQQHRLLWDLIRPFEVSSLVRRRLHNLCPHPRHREPEESSIGDDDAE
eukprot:179240_1